jgi:hypothetical protein
MVSVAIKIFKKTKKIPFFLWLKSGIRKIHLTFKSKGIFHVRYPMKTIKPSMCTLEGPISLCDCSDKNFKEEQKKCLTYSRGKKGYCEYYRSLLGACSNYDGYFSNIEKR